MKLKYLIFEGEDASNLGAFIAEACNDKDLRPTELEHKEISQGLNRLHILEDYMTT